MKKYCFVLFFVIFHFFNPASAQERFDACLFAGLNMCQIDGDGAGSYNHPGLRAGVGTSFSLESDVRSPWRMVVEIAFTNKGSYIGAYDRTLSVNYVEVPVMLACCAMDGRLRLAAGVAPAVRVSSQVTDSGIEDRPASDNFAAGDWLPLTASVRYLFSDHLGIEGRYQNSMISITKQNGSGTYRIFRSNTGCFNNLLSVGLVYQF